MASDAPLNQCQDTAAIKDQFSSVCPEISPENYQQQQQFMSSNLCVKHEVNDSTRFIQQHQVYGNARVHKGFIQNHCNCYQNGSSQGCSGCQANEEQNNAGAFIYETIQADVDTSLTIELRAQGIRSGNQSTGYLEQGNKHISNPFQEPLYENGSKYYMNEPQQLSSYSSCSSNNNNNGDSSESGDLISARCQTTTFNSSDRMIENDAALSGGGINPFYQQQQCSNSSGNKLSQWPERSLMEKDLSGYEFAISTNQNRLFSCSRDSNNNNNTLSQKSFQFSSALYEPISIAQDVKEPSCKFQQYHNDNYTSSRQYESYPPPGPISHQFEVGQSYDSTVAQQQQQVPELTQLSSDINRSQPQDPFTRQYSDEYPIEADQRALSSYGSAESPHQSCSQSSSSVSYQNQNQQQTVVDHGVSQSQNKESTKTSRTRRKNSASLSKVNGKLWEFIRDLLLNEHTNPEFIRWERREDGVFKFVQSNKVAKMWGERKQNPKMTYEKLSRAMRYYYKSKVLLPVFGRRLVYKFGPNSSGWNKQQGTTMTTTELVDRRSIMGSTGFDDDLE